MTQFDDKTRQPIFSLDHRPEAFYTHPHPRTLNTSPQHSNKEPSTQTQKPAKRACVKTSVGKRIIFGFEVGEPRVFVGFELVLAKQNN
jgi:hypothetical protein